MIITLKNVKIAKFASEETLCFRATVLVDGKVAGEASNDGHGGANRYQPWSLRDTLTEYAASLPPWTAHGETHAHDADTAFGDVMDAWQIKKDFERAVAKKIVLVKTDGKLYTASVPKGSDLAAAAARFVGRTGITSVLNLLPTDEALAAWTAAHARVAP